MLSTRSDDGAASTGSAVSIAAAPGVVSASPAVSSCWTKVQLKFQCDLPGRPTPLKRNVPPLPPAATVSNSKNRKGRCRELSVWLLCLLPPAAKLGSTAVLYALRPASGGVQLIPSTDQLTSTWSSSHTTSLVLADARLGWLHVAPSDLACRDFSKPCPHVASPPSDFDPCDVLNVHGFR